MIDAICFVQEGRIGEEQQRQLEVALGDITQSFFSDNINISWNTVARGNGWTGVGPATGTNLGLFVPDISQEKRTALLTEVCEQWMRVTGCKIMEIVASAINRDGG